MATAFKSSLTEMLSNTAEQASLDTKLAARALRRDPAFTLGVIAVLTVALALNVGIFTIMDAMLFRGFPLVKRNDRLVYIQETYPSGLCCISYKDFEDWRAQTKTLEAMAFVTSGPTIVRDDDKRPTRASSARVSANTFELVGVPPLLGRDFDAADEAPGAEQVVILSYEFWEAYFDKRSDIVGRVIRVNDLSSTVIGVLHEGFAFPVEKDLWRPLAPSPELQHRDPGGGGYMAVGRLRDTVSVEQARAELETIGGRLEAAYPDTNRGVVPRVATWSEMFVGQGARSIYGWLWAGAWMVFLIACGNLANLTLVRTLGRWREISIHAALGANRLRLARQIILENLILSGVAGVLGWWLAKWGVRIWAVLTRSPNQVLDYTLGTGALMLCVTTTVGAAIVVSVAPCIKLFRYRTADVAPRDIHLVAPPRRRPFQSAVIAGQMALAIVLLSGAGILCASYMNIINAETGVREPERVLVGSVRLLPGDYSGPSAMLQYFDRVETQVRTLPGVQEVSLASVLPVDSGRMRMFEIVDKPSPPEGFSVQFITSSPDYFQTIGVGVLAGRVFKDADHGASLPVAVVNKSFVDRFWPGEKAIGKQLRTVNRNATDEWRTVVGIVANVMQGDGPRQTFKPIVYVPFRQNATSHAYLLARTSVPPRTLVQTALSSIDAIDPNAILSDFSTLEASLGFNAERMDQAHSGIGRHAALAPIFAAVALLLAALGLYAVITQSINQRTREIGVRVAIGATPGDILRLLLIDGLWPVAAGTAIGLAASTAVNRGLSSLLVGVTPYDPTTIAGAVSVLMCVALVACAVPVRRAVLVDPVAALRHD